MENNNFEKTAIISGGEFSPLCGIENATFVIACDKGLKYALENGARVDTFVGDGDSIGDIAVPEGIKSIDLPTVKDDTDTMEATRFAVSSGAREITFYCACGGRYDHFLGNLQAAAFAAENGVKVRIIDLYADFYIFSHGKFSFKKQKDAYFSVLSLSDKCEGVNISGAKYSLKNAMLKNDFPLGVSNEWQDSEQNEITVSVKSGVLAVIICKDK